MTSQPIHFEDLKWGSFTKQFQAYKSQHPKSKVKDLDAFAKMIVKTPKKYQEKTLKRARFYLNVIEKKKTGAGEGGAESGGKISISNLQGLLKKSYDKKPSNYMDYEVDKDLSDDKVQVYKNKKTGEVVVSHRGTQGLGDMALDLKYALGYDLHDSNRYKHAQDIQRKAESKYGAENITTIGHSLGSKIGRDVGQNGKEVIELNPAYNIPDALKKKSDKTYSIRTQYDPVSFLLPLFKGKDKNTTTIESKTLNPLAEHTVGVLDRTDQEKEIGKGFNKMSLKELKSHAKKLPKEHRIPLTRIKKKDLLAHLNKVGGLVYKPVTDNLFRDQYENHLYSGGMFSWVKKVFDKNPQLTREQREQAERFADELESGDPTGVSFEGSVRIDPKIRKQLAEEWFKEQQERTKMSREDKR
jgi:hypothetical protein